MAVPELVVLVAGPAGGDQMRVAAAVAARLPVWPLAALLGPAPPHGGPAWRAEREGPLAYLDRHLFDPDPAPHPRVVVAADADELAARELFEPLAARGVGPGLAVVRVGGNPVAAALSCGLRAPAGVAAACRDSLANWVRLGGVTPDRFDYDPDRESPAQWAALAAFLDLPRLTPPPKPPRPADLPDPGRLCAKLPREWQGDCRKALG